MVSAEQVASDPKAPLNNHYSANLNSGQTSLSYIVASLTGVAWFNALELVLLIFVTFTRWKGIYFWSILLSSAAIVPYMLGFLLYFFQLTSNNWVSMTLVTIGWWPMVTGQSVVLWSRLHLVSTNPDLLRKIKWMIITNAILFHTPTTILTFLATGPTDGGSPQEQYGYGIMEKIQMTAFCIQEFIISTVYLLETVKLLKTSYHEKKRKVMYQLIFVNAFIIIIDLALLGVEYASLYQLETTLKGIVYSIKLRLEFAVLNQLVAFTRAPRSNSLDATLTRPEFDTGLFKAGTNGSMTGSELGRHHSPSSGEMATGTPNLRRETSADQSFAETPRLQVNDDDLHLSDRDLGRRCRKESWVQDFAYRGTDD